ncbi:MAG: hypothetical protein ACREEP_07820 [Dongiaceae bacterium]
MKTFIIATAAALMLGAPLALAAGTTTTHQNLSQHRLERQPVLATTLSERCVALGQQFDKVEPQHQSDKNFKQALALRSEGKSLCTAHKEAKGIKKIESALSMIGVKPEVKS